MATTNIWQQFKSLIPEGVRVIAKIRAHNGNGTSQAELRSGTVLNVKGETVEIGKNAFIQGGEVKGKGDVQTAWTMIRNKLRDFGDVTDASNDEIIKNFAER